jgi:hypothetical protein
MASICSGWLQGRPALKGAEGSAAGLVLAFVTASPALAGVSLTFQGLTNTNAYNTALGESQLVMNVDGTGAAASFVLSNVGPWALSATDIYFDDSGLLGAASVVNGVGTAFAQTVSPASLPGAGLVNPAFESSISFGTAGTPPIYFQGVNPGESVRLDFQLAGSATIDAVYEALTSGALRIGVRVRGTEVGGEDSLINRQVPAPGSAALVGVAGLVLASRRR